MDGHVRVCMPYSGRAVDLTAARGINKAMILPLNPLSASDVARHKDWPEYRLSSEFQSVKFTVLGRGASDASAAEVHDASAALAGSGSPVVPLAEAPEDVGPAASEEAPLVEGPEAGVEDPLEG